MKEKDEEKMVRMVIAAAFALPIIYARERNPPVKMQSGTIDLALELADELIRKAK